MSAISPLCSVRAGDCLPMVGSFVCFFMVVLLDVLATFVLDENPDKHRTSGQPCHPWPLLTHITCGIVFLTFIRNMTWRSSTSILYSLRRADRQNIVVPPEH